MNLESGNIGRGLQPLVEFYEKPGCINNAKQKKILLQAGVKLDVKNLLKSPWTEALLNKYLADKPIEDCINKTAPAIKNGSVKVENLSRQEVLAEMRKDPLLIRRPLIHFENNYIQGFDWNELQRILKLSDRPDLPEDLEVCPRQEKF